MKAMEAMEGMKEEPPYKLHLLHACISFNWFLFIHLLGWRYAHHGELLLLWNPPENLAYV